MGDYELYQAIKSFTPSSDDEQEFQKGDVFEITIQSPFDTNQSYRPGWLFAYNRRTRGLGFVPVEYVKLLGSEVGKTIHHPSACGVEVVNKSDMENKPEHKLEDAFFLTPILCKHYFLQFEGCASRYSSRFLQNSLMKNIIFVKLSCIIY
nr:uncharacterized protein LOC111503083 [Leptinotarsa decemlineata]